MKLTQIVPGLYQISLGVVNAFLLDTGDLTLIDTGVPGSEEDIITAVQEIGRQATDIKHILITHLHADHSGSLAALKAASGAPAAMHPLDAALVRRGESTRPSQAAPGLVNKFIVNFAMARMKPAGISPTPIERELTDGQTLPDCGGLQVIHVPGHSVGQVAFLWPEQGGVLFAADSASHMFGLGYPPIFEDFDQGLQSLKKLSALPFQVACFGHGSALTQDASAQFQKKWA